MFQNNNFNVLAIYLISITPYASTSLYFLRILFQPDMFPFHRCKGASHYGLTKERKRRSQDGFPDCSSSLDLTVAAVSSELSAASAAALVSDETGQDNPVYSSPTGDSHLGSGSEEHCRINRNRSKLTSTSWKQFTIHAFTAAILH